MKSNPYIFEDSDITECVKIDRQERQRLVKNKASARINKANRKAGNLFDEPNDVIEITDNRDVLREKIKRRNRKRESCEDSIYKSLHNSVDVHNFINQSDTHKEVFSETKPPFDEKNITLHAIATELLKRVILINVENRLYYYCRYCYLKLDKKDLVTLYRDNVDETLHNVKSMRLFINELYDYLLTDSRLKREVDYAECKNLAFLKNGIYDIKKQVLYKHNPSIIAFSYIDANYKENPKCKAFDRFLYDITDGNEVLQLRFWYFLAYIFSQSVDAKVFFVMGTAPNSGKSVLGKFIQRLFPKNHVSNIAVNEMHKEFALAPLVGSAVNISMDLPATKLNEAAVSSLKQVTGDDTIVINEKYVPRFSYYNRAKFIFGTNHQMGLTHQDDAFWNRLVYLPFTKSVSKQKQNTNLLEELLKEKDDIVSKALQYGKGLWDNFFEFPVTTNIEETMLRWQGKSNSSITNFLQHNCSFDDETAIETAEALYNAYCLYCDDRALDKVSRMLFVDFLKNQVGLIHRKVRKNSTNPLWCFEGITLELEDDDYV